MGFSHERQARDGRTRIMGKICHVAPVTAKMPWRGRNDTSIKVLIEGRGGK